MIYTYREPEQGEQIVIAADPAEGNDYSAWVALSKRTADVIMIGKSKEESSQLGHTINHVGKWINARTNIFPSIGVERNVGSATIYVLKTLNYPNIFKMPDSFTKRTDQEQHEKYGWHTNTATRPKMLDDLALAIRQKAIKIPSKILIDELYTFVRNEKTGKPEAEVGCHDDLVISLAIAWQMYSLVGVDYSLQTKIQPPNPFDYIRIGEPDRVYPKERNFRIGE